MKKSLILSGILVLALAAIPIFIKKKRGEKENVSKPNEEYHCKALTVSGKRCSRLALPDSDYCWQHENLITSA